jgi:hypothetical protein
MPHTGRIISRIISIDNRANIYFVTKMLVMINTMILRVQNIFETASSSDSDAGCYVIIIKSNDNLATRGGDP